MRNDTRVLASETVVERTAVQNISTYVRARGRREIECPRPTRLDSQRLIVKRKLLCCLAR